MKPELTDLSRKAAPLSLRHFVTGAAGTLAAEERTAAAGEAAQQQKAKTRGKKWSVAGNS